MSTIPGDDALRDAGLTGADLSDAVELAPDADDRPVDPDLADALTPGGAVPGAGPSSVDPEEHTATPARPDLDGSAAEADVLDQTWETPLDDGRE